MKRHEQLQACDKLILKNRLSEIVSQINESNLHAEVETGEAVGKEVWQIKTISPIAET